jgi:micrococcal nuclease
MFSNTKFLILSCFLVIVFGLGFLWFGFSNNKQNLNATPTPSEPIATTSASLDTEEKFLVTKVVDGDTIILENGQTVRFIGIDTPETVDPRRPVGCFGKEASNKTKSLLTGKEVILKKDVSDTDKYQRILRYVYLPLDDGQTLFVNDYLVREGYAKNYTYPPDVKYNEQFLQAEKEARENKRGLWEKC